MAKNNKKDGSDEEVELSPEELEEQWRQREVNRIILEDIRKGLE